MSSRKDSAPSTWPYVVFSYGNRTWEMHVPQVPQKDDYVRLLPHEYSSQSEGFVVLCRTWMPDHTKYDAEVTLRPDCE